MQPSDIRAGQLLQGKSADADKQRLVEAIDTKRREATTRVYRVDRDGTRIDLGTDVISVATLARWAAGEVARV